MELKENFKDHFGGGVSSIKEDNSVSQGLSIIIVTYNNEKTVRACLDSIIRQECDFLYEIIVVDNGSFEELILTNSYNLKFIQNVNVGFGAGNNLGVKYAKYDKLLFINPDTVLEDDFLQSMYDKIQARVVITPKIVLLNHEDKINTCGNILHFSGYSFINGYLRGREEIIHDMGLTGISGAAFGILKEDFFRVSGFDEDFFLYMEDTELSWKINKAGMKIRLSASSVIRHDYRLDVTSQKFYLLEKGRIILLRKHFSPLQFIFFLPSLFLAEVLSCSWLLRYGIGGFIAKAKAYRAGLLMPLTKRGKYQKRNNYGFLGCEIPFETLTQNRLLIHFGRLFNLLFELNMVLYRLIFIK